MRDWEQCFVEQTAPVLRSQLLAALMSGTPLEFERIPTTALLDAVVLCTIARNHCQAEVVDDYPALLDRAKEEWCVDGGNGVYRMHQIHQVCWLLERSNNDLNAPEDYYLPAMVQRFLEMEVPQYIRKEK